MIGNGTPATTSSFRKRRSLLRSTPGITIEQHYVVRITGPIDFVDNVITTGATADACRRALGWDIGLEYADPSLWRSRCHAPYVA